jgi:hypothetical protein
VVQQAFTRCQVHAPRMAVEQRVPRVASRSLIRAC